MSENKKSIVALNVTVVAVVLGLSFTGMAGAQIIDCDTYSGYAGRLTKEIVQACGQTPVEVTEQQIFAPTDPAMGVDVFGDQLVSWTLNNYPGFTVVAASTVDSYAMDFDIDGTTLWAMENTLGQLGTIDLATSAFTGYSACTDPDGGTFSGLTIDPSTGNFYASSITALYSIDPTDPSGCNPTLIGTFGTTGATIIDIAMNGSGQMYAHDVVDDALYSVDPATGAATLIGSTGYDANYAQGMDFDHDDGTLYAFLLTIDPTEYYGTFDLATGAFTVINTNALGEHEFGVQLPGVPVELQSFSVE